MFLWAVAGLTLKGSNPTSLCCLVQNKLKVCFLYSSFLSDCKTLRPEKQNCLFAKTSFSKKLHETIRRSESSFIFEIFAEISPSLLRFKTRFLSTLIIFSHASRLPPRLLTQCCCLIFCHYL